MTKHEYSVEEVRRAAERMDREGYGGKMLTAYADLREQIELAKDGVTDEVAEIAYKRNSEALLAGLTSRKAMFRAIQAIAHLMPSRAAQVVGEPIARVKDGYALEWTAPNYGMSVKAGDLLYAQPRVPDGLKELADEVEACWICASIGEGEITLETINNWSGRLSMLAAPQPKDSK
jgi:hypothetical protein